MSAFDPTLRFRYNQLPSAGAAVATAAAVTLMATLQQTTFEAIRRGGIHGGLGKQRGKDVGMLGKVQVFFVWMFFPGDVDKIR